MYSFDTWISLFRSCLNFRVFFAFTLLFRVLWEPLSIDSLYCTAPSISGLVLSRAVLVVARVAKLSVLCATIKRFCICTSLLDMFASGIWKGRLKTSSTTPLSSRKGGRFALSSMGCVNLLPKQFPFTNTGVGTCGASVPTCAITTESYMSLVTDTKEGWLSVWSTEVAAIAVSVARTFTLTGFEFESTIMRFAGKILRMYLPLNDVCKSRAAARFPTTTIHTRVRRPPFRGCSRINFSVLIGCLFALVSSRKFWHLMHKDQVGRWNDLLFRLGPAPVSLKHLIWVNYAVLYWRGRLLCNWCSRKMPFQFDLTWGCNFSWMELVTA